VGSLSWLVFVPVALGFGALSTAHGVQRAGWVLVALAMLAGTLLAVTARSARSAESAESAESAQSAAGCAVEPALV
jgi:hypothetical protein